MTAARNNEQYRQLLGVGPAATPDELDAAYAQQRERYSPARLAELDADFQRLARERLAELDSAYRALRQPAGGPANAGLTRREWLMAGGGVLVGLLLIGLVWVLAGRTAPTGLPPVATMNRPAPDWTLETTDGKQLSLAELRGKVVLLNFWYTNCPPCIEETPALQQAHARLADQGVVIVGVNVRGQERTGADGDEDVRRFARQNGVTYPIVFDRAATAERDYQTYVLPTSFFIDQTGTIRYARFSTLTAKEVEQIATQLLSESPRT